MSNEKKYLRGSAKERTFDNGGATLYFSINIKSMLSGQDNKGHSVEEFVDDDGWLNLATAKKRATDQYGNTNSVWLNEWKPDAAYQKPSSAPSPEKADEDTHPPF